MTFAPVPARRLTPPKPWFFLQIREGFGKQKGPSLQLAPPEHQKSIFSCPGASKINIFSPQSTKNQYFLSLEHQNSIFCVPGAPKINIFCPRSTKNQYFLSPWQSTKNQYLLSPEHHNSIFSLRIRLTNNQTPRAVACMQLCCALDKIRLFVVHFGEINSELKSGKN